MPGLPGANGIPGMKGEYGAPGPEGAFGPPGKIIKKNNSIQKVCI